MNRLHKKLMLNSKNYFISVNLSITNDKSLQIQMKIRSASDLQIYLFIFKIINSKHRVFESSSKVLI